MTTKTITLPGKVWMQSLAAQANETDALIVEQMGIVKSALDAYRESVRSEFFYGGKSHDDQLETEVANHKFAIALPSEG